MKQIKYLKENALPELDVDSIPKREPLIIAVGSKTYVTMISGNTISYSDVTCVIGNPYEPASIEEFLRELLAIGQFKVYKNVGGRLLRIRVNTVAPKGIKLSNCDYRHLIKLYKYGMLEFRAIHLDNMWRLIKGGVVVASRRGLIELIETESKIDKFEIKIYDTEG